MTTGLSRFRNIYFPYYHFFIIVVFVYFIVPLNAQENRAWKIVQGAEPLPHFRAICCIPEQNSVGEKHRSALFIAGFDGIVYYRKPKDNRWRWSRVPGRERLFSIHFDSPQQGWTGGWGGALYRTRDGAQTWQRIETGTSLRITGISRSPDGCLHIIGDNGFWSIGIDNDTIFQSPRKLGDHGLRAIAFNKKGHGIIVGYRGNDWLTHDNGKNWQEINALQDSKMDLYGCAITQHSLWVVGAFGHVLTSDLEGRNWKTVDLKTLAYFRHITFSSAHLGIITGYGVVYRTTDGGNTWQQIIRDVPYQLLCSCYSVEQDVWSAGEYGTLYQWNVFNRILQGPLLGVGVTINEIAMNERNNTIWAVAENNTLFRSDDDGEHWSPSHLGKNTDLNAILFDRNAHGYIGGDKGSLWISQDDGQEWSFTEIPEKKDIFGLTLAPDNTVWLCGRLGLLYNSNDNGAHWMKVKTRFDNDFRKIVFVDRKIGWIVGDDGRILETVDGGNFFFANYTGTGIDFCGLDRNKKSITIVGQSGTIMENISGGQGSSWNLSQIPGGISLNDVESTAGGWQWIVGDGGSLWYRKGPKGNWQKEFLQIREDLFTIFSFNKTILAGGQNSCIIIKK